MVKKTTYETNLEYNDYGKVSRKVVTETVDIPDSDYTVVYDCCDGYADLLEDTIEFEEEPSLLDVIAGVAGIASIVASACLIAKAFRNK